VNHWLLFFLGEMVTPLKIAGIIAATTGVLLLSL
jgi:drug/metabolite transporter (DMT)-like permease